MKTSFEQWMKQVDAHCMALCGLSVHDLPDVCFADWYEDGISPKSAAKRAIKYAKSEY